MTKKRGENFHSGKFGAALSIQVKTGGKKNSIKEVRSDGLMIVKLATSSSDESSHPLLKSLLSSVLGVDPSNVDIVAGAQSDYKLVSIIGVDSQRVDELVRAAVKKPE